MSKYLLLPCVFFFLSFVSPGSSPFSPSSRGRVPAGGSEGLYTALGGPGAEYLIHTRDLDLVLSPEGRILRIRMGGHAAWKEMNAFPGIEGCRLEGPVAVTKNKAGTLVFRMVFVNDALHRSCSVTESFIPTSNSIRWEMAVEGLDQAWSSAIFTEFGYPSTTQTRFWAPWGAPPVDSVWRQGAGGIPGQAGTESRSSKEQALAESLRPFPGGSEQGGFMGEGNNQWVDPLVPVPFMDTTYYYGLPYFKYDAPMLGACPFQGNLFCIPMCSVMEPEEDRGVTFALSPENDLIDLVMHTGSKGNIRFSRLFHRIEQGKPLRLSLDIISHPADWRCGLAWMTRRYPGFFFPKSKSADLLAGTGAYAGPFEKVDPEKMRSMDFHTNWQASFDFPYMGMFLPPVGKNVRWKRFGGDSISITGMSDYSCGMKKMGFHVLNYFNVTEFGAKVRDSGRLREAAGPAGAGVGTATVTGGAHEGAGAHAGRYADAGGKEDDLWKDCNLFLSEKLSAAILRGPLRMKFEQDRKNRPGGPIYTWEDGIAMDCGDPAYKQFLLGQAARHLRYLPCADGICIDRLDWLRFFNEWADDGRTWFGGQPVRSLVHSFKELMDTLGPLMHHAGKSIFVNNHDKRLDILEQADGIFDEFTYAGSPLNLTALLSVDKPALGWTDAASTVKNEGPDRFFQKYLYMGVFPMCPYPANDHSIGPDTLVDRYYQEYAPLLRLLHGRKWVLEPHVIHVEKDSAKANLFRTPGGYAIPVVYGRASHITLSVDLQGSRFSYWVWWPGEKKAFRINPLQAPSRGPQGGKPIRLEVPLSRGCAMVSIRSDAGK